MNDETLKMLEKQQEDCVKDAASLDAILEPKEKSEVTLTVKESQKIILDERQMRVEESKLELEWEKFQYQKKRDKNDNLTKIAVALSPVVPALIVGGVDMWKTNRGEKLAGCFIEYERDNIWSGPTIRKMVTDLISRIH